MQTAYRIASPLVPAEEAVILECPVGKVLRETPEVYDAIAFASYLESGSVSFFNAPAWLQTMCGAYNSEKMRLMQQDRDNRKSASDADYGRRVLGG